jgi:hypothetical protein
MVARSLMAVSLALAVAAPFQAQARFGKRSSSDDQQSGSGSNSSGNGGSSSDDQSSNEVHAATAVGTAPPDRSYSPPPSCGGSCDPCGHGYSDCGYHDRGWSYYAYEPAYVGGGAAAATVSADSGGWNVRTALMTEVQGFTSGDGGLLSFGMLIEGVQWGVDVDGRLIEVATDDGTAGTDSLRLLNGAVTWTLFGDRTSRIRLEGGFAVAFAPDVTVVSPQVGVSMGFGFGGSWGVEGLVRASLVPHTQVEWSAGMSYAMGPLGVRAGWRRIFLDDRGIVDGVAHQDVFAGPYVGLGLAF